MVDMDLKTGMWHGELRALRKEDLRLTAKIVAADGSAAANRHLTTRRESATESNGRTPGGARSATVAAGVMTNDPG
jgi:hypothetical protein